MDPAAAMEEGTEEEEAGSAAIVVARMDPACVVPADTSVIWVPPRPKKEAPAADQKQKWRWKNLRK